MIDTDPVKGGTFRVYSNRDPIKRWIICTWSKDGEFMREEWAQTEHSLQMICDALRSRGARCVNDPLPFEG